MTDRLHFSATYTAPLRHNGAHAVNVTTTQENGEWWTEMTVDGVVLAHETFGPVDEVHPPAPRITKARRK